MTTDLDITQLRGWDRPQRDGRRRGHARAAAARERDAGPRRPLPRAGDPVPPCWHWLYFPPAARITVGDRRRRHPRRGGFLPPVPLRRMWAGSRFRFVQPLRAGQALAHLAHRRRCGSKRARPGRSCSWSCATRSAPRPARHRGGARHRLPRAAAAGRAGAGRAAGARGAQWTRGSPDPVLLFRYSALTFNGHRIHYDRSLRHRRGGLSGLVVHGPLIATAAAPSCCAARCPGDADALRVPRRRADLRRGALPRLRPARRCAHGPAVGAHGAGPPGDGRRATLA